MRAVDTNVVILFLMEDDPDQFSRAFAILRREQVLVTVTVILESEWVMRRSFRLPRHATVTALRSLFGTPGVEVQSAPAVAKALGWFEQGMDFADALHLAIAQDCDGLVTFDRDFIKTAARIGAGNVAEP